jgi:site-specific DNA-methyltransferase (adenine-specific)
MIQLLHADCLEYMKGLPDKAFELAIVDPPYGIGESGQRNKTGDRPTAKWKNPKSVNYKTFDDSKAPSFEYFNELKRVSNHQIIWGGNYFTEFLEASMGWVIWDKKVDEKEHLSMAEMAWSSFNKKAMLFELLWAGFKKGEQTERIHPTQKPVALYKWLLQNYAKPGDRILDTHLGSGSIAIACHDMGFDLTGCELDKDYYDAAVKRLKTHQLQPQLFEPKETFQHKQSNLF